MNLKKTVIASAVLLATGSVFAYEMPELPTKFDNEVVQTNDTNQNSGLTDFDGVGIVKPMQGNNGAGSPSFMYGNGEGVELTNKGDIWVVAGDLGKDGSYGNYANGMIANNGATATNNGTIYVKSEAKFSGGTPNYSGAKGMTSDGQGTIINNGTIVVDGGVAMNVGTTADHQTVTNSGTIIVKEGYGIAFNREKTEGTPTSVEPKISSGIS